MKQKTVGDLIRNLERFPRDLPIIYAVDEEGNAYHPVYMEPTKGFHLGYEFIGKEELELGKKDKDPLMEKILPDWLEIEENGVLSVCIN